jgi:non-ribosomal peptide synthetase component F
LRRQENTTLGVLLLLAWQMLARRWSGQDRFFMIYNGAGRLRPKHREVAGLFAHYLPIGVDLSGEPSPRDAIARTHARYRRMLAEEGVPAYRALADSGRATGLFVNHVALGVGDAEAGFGSQLVATPMPDKAQIVRLAYPVLIYVFETKAGVSGTIYYADELFGAAEMERFVGEFVEIAASLAAES